MAKSKVLADLANGDVPINVALKRIMVLTRGFEDKAIFDWAQYELGGYDNDTDVPQYRCIRGDIRGNYQSMSGGILRSFTKASLPTTRLTEECVDAFKLKVFNQGIVVLRELASKEMIVFPLPMETYQFFEDGTNIKVTDAYVAFSSDQIQNILSRVESLTLTLLIDLDKYYGNLDSLDIEYKPTIEQKLIEKEIVNIIFEDNSVRIGDNNSLNKSGVLSKGGSGIAPSI